MEKVEGLTTTGDTEVSVVDEGTTEPAVEIFVLVSGIV
jgi:hypothetical protein